MGDFRIIERPVRDQLGEGLMWSARRATLFWVDIVGQALHALHLESGKITSWAMPAAIGWALERTQSDELIVGLKTGFAHVRLDPLTITAIADPEPDRPHNRLNDAAVDHAGRIWAGSKDDRDEVSADEVSPGALYRLDPDFTVTRHDDGYGVTNGPTFSIDGRTLYHTDSPARTVYAFTLADDGSLHDKRVFTTFEHSWGYPDGMTTDAQGGIWIAHWGGAQVSRFDPAGKRERSIALPTSQISNCTFGGERLDRMFVTSAAIGVEHEPHAGALFEVDPGTTGLRSNAFGG